MFRSGFTDSQLHSIWNFTGCGLQKNTPSELWSLFNTLNTGYWWTFVLQVTIFGKPSDIPHHFVRDQVKQYGRVTKIEPSQLYGPLLVVQHHPPAKVFFWSSKTIPIKIDGIAINANGYSWLQSVVTGKEICFIPMKEPSSAAQIECRVCINDSKKQIDVGEALLSLGFAKLSVPVPKSVQNRKDVHAVALYQYYRTLAKAERYAKDRRNGLWQSSLGPRVWPLSLWPVLWDRVTNPNRVPALVRWCTVPIYGSLQWVRNNRKLAVCVMHIFCWCLKLVYLWQKKQSIKCYKSYLNLRFNTVLPAFDVDKIRNPNWSLRTETINRTIERLTFVCLYAAKAWRKQCETSWTISKLLLCSLCDPTIISSITYFISCNSRRHKIPKSFNHTYYRCTTVSHVIDIIQGQHYAQCVLFELTSKQWKR